MATREQLIEDFADHKYATGEKFARLINSMKVVQEPVTDPQASGTSHSFIDSISQSADGKITATKKSVVLSYAQIQDKPTINGVTLMGDQTAAQLGLATANQVEVVSNKVDKLPSGYYYGKFNSVEDLPEATEKGYAYVASSDPTVFYTYLVSGAGAEWADSGNKMVNTIDLTTPKTTGTELSKGEKYYASANVNDRPADVVAETGVVKALGYRVLNPNLSFAEQVESTQTVNNSNMIFEIKDSFDLGGGSVTIPANCTLKFNGGKLTNGDIKGQHTKIIAEQTKIFENMQFSWYWREVPEAYPEWFGAIGNDSNVDSVDAIQACINAFPITKLSSFPYYVSKSLKIPNYRTLVGENRTYSQLIVTQNIDYAIIPYTNTLTGDDFAVARGIRLSNFSVSKSEGITLQKGIYLKSATNTFINNIYVGGAVVGFALNAFFGGEITHCTAGSCETGYYFGIDAGNSTSILHADNYALSCTTGHVFRNCSYITAISPSADDCITAYEFIGAKMVLDSAGAERSTTFFKIVERTDLGPQVYNFTGNNIQVNNAVCYNNQNNSTGVINIVTRSRANTDVSRVEFNGFYIRFESQETTDKIFNYAGDIMVYFNRVNIPPTMSMSLTDVIGRHPNVFLDGTNRLTLGTVGYTNNKIQGDQSFLYNYNTRKSYPIWFDGTKWVTYDSENYDISRTGTSSQRPTPTNIGFLYFDTTLGKPIFWNGTVWVDANGVLLSEIQVSDKSVLLAAAANSSNTVEVYTSDTPTIAVKNPDDTDASSWLSASLSGTTLTITATTANATNPRGGKVVLTNTTDEVVINVVQNYV